MAVTKLADLASPLLMMYSSMGKTLSKARLEFMRADGSGTPIRYYEIELENVLIASIDQSAHGMGIIHDAIGLRFSKVKWRYTQQKIGGGTCGNTAGGWDLSLNRCA